MQQGPIVESALTAGVTKSGSPWAVREVQNQVSGEKIAGNINNGMPRYGEDAVRL